MNRIIQEFKKRKELILYLFFGGCTTLVNIFSYFVLRNVGTNVTVATVIAWAVSVLFAYVTNRIFVFESKKTGSGALMREFAAFVSGRISTGVLDLVLMIVLVDMMHLYEPVIKIASNIIVIILNYVLSKLWIFKK